MMALVSARDVGLPGENKEQLGLAPVSIYRIYRQSSQGVAGR